MKYKLLLLLLALQVLKTSLKAQISYSFSKSPNNVYSELAGDNMVTGFNSDDLFAIPGLAGETFEFYNLPFTFGNLTSLSIGKFPFLEVDNGSLTVIIDGAFSETDTIDAATRVSYQLSGSAGNRLLKVQYKNFKLQFGPSGNFINVQFWYYQQSGIIEIHYGPRSANNASGYNTSLGPHSGIFYAPNTFSHCLEKLWCNGLPGNLTLDSTANFQFNSMLGVPEEGTIYRFTPRKKNLVSIPEIFHRTEPFFFPNPANERIEWRSENNIFKISLYNSLGQCIREQANPYGASGEMDISLLKEGVYLIKVEDHAGNTSEKKMLIRR